MKVKVKIEDVQLGDKIGGKQVAEILHRDSVGYVRLILEGGRNIIDGYRGDMVEVQRRAQEC